MKSIATIPLMCCGSFAAPLETHEAERIASCFKALADPTRVSIVNRLAATDECCVCDLTDAFDLSQPTVSHHLKVLKDAGLVESRRRGTWAYYRLVPDAVRELRNTLGGVGSTEPPRSAGDGFAGAGAGKA